jgi:hypothetical protein
MWKSVIYKEWLKTRWIIFVFAGLGILAVGNIFLKVKHDFAFNEPTNYLYRILYMNMRYFSYGLFKFIPVVGAAAIAISQYFPETINKRIKLTFHLPLNENKVLLMMTLFGTFCLLSVYLLIYLLFLFLSALYFPLEIIQAALISVTPWFLSGFVIYYLTTLIVLEPVWKYRFLYLIVAGAFVPVYLETSVAGAYAPVIPVLAVLSAILSISLLFSGYRFRKGEM